MAKSRKTAYLLVVIVLTCSIYWLQEAMRAITNLETKQLKVAGKAQDLLGKYEKEDDSVLKSTKISGNDQKSQAQGELLESKGPTTSPLLPVGYTAAFPRHIWQTSSEAGRDKYADQIQTWKGVKGFNYHWLSDAGADEFVHKTFSATRPSLVAFWDDLSSKLSQPATGQSHGGSSNASEIVVDSTASSAIVLRADLLRYMLMFAQGGVYADIDTSVMLHVDRWIPENLGSHVINAIIGIEYDDTTYKMFVRPISFCQWTLMAKPNHPIFDRAINRVVSNIEFLARRQKIQSLSQLTMDKLDVLEATGPGMISDVVLEVIRDQLPEQEISWTTFHNQKEAKLFGDVLILPINGFAGSQKHSHAGDPQYGEKLVQHHFGRSWYQPKKAGLVKTP